MLSFMDRPLTKTQIQYLDEIVTRRLTRGWGGYSSTQTVRILQERGYITLHDHYSGWRAAPTDKGRAYMREHWHSVD